MQKSPIAPKKFRKRTFRKSPVSDDEDEIVINKSSPSAVQNIEITSNTHLKMTFEEKMLKKTEKYAKINKNSEDLSLKYQGMESKAFDFNEYQKKILPNLNQIDFDFDAIKDPEESKGLIPPDFSLFCTLSEITPDYYQEVGINRSIDQLKQSPWDIWYPVPNDLPELSNSILSDYLNKTNTKELLISIISMLESGLKVDFWGMKEMIYNRISRQPYLVPIYRTLYPFLGNLEQNMETRELILLIAYNNLLDHTISYIARDSVVRQACFYPDSPFYEGTSCIDIADSVKLNLEEVKSFNEEIPAFKLPIDAVIIRTRYYVSHCVSEYVNSLNKSENFSMNHVKDIIKLLYAVIVPNLANSSIEGLWCNFQNISSVITEFADYPLLRNTIQRIHSKQTDPYIRCAKTIRFCIKKQILSEMLILLHLSATSSSSSPFLMKKEAVIRFAYELIPLSKLKINIKHQDLLLKNL